MAGLRASPASPRWVLAAAHEERERALLLAPTACECRLAPAPYHAGYASFQGPSDQSANDIAMLGLTTAPPLSPIALASQVPTPGDVVYAAGYGAIEPGAGAPTADSLMLTDMLVYDPASCTDPGSPFADDFCAGMAYMADGSNGGHACHGDSGGPVVTSDGYLTGVVSWGKEDCSVPYSFYTAVAQHLDIINAMMAAWQPV